MPDTRPTVVESADDSLSVLFNGCVGASFFTALLLDQSFSPLCIKKIDGVKCAPGIPYKSQLYASVAFCSDPPQELKSHAREAESFLQVGLHKVKIILFECLQVDAHVRFKRRSEGNTLP